MYFDKITNQWILENIYEATEIVGMELSRKVLNGHFRDIDPGQIVVFDNKGVYDKVAFQTLEKINLLFVSPSDIVGYEPGSVISLKYGKPPRIIPTFKFRNCRFPTISEYLDYERINSL